MIEIEERPGNRIELTLVGFCECPTCGRDCTEIWQDGSGGNRLRCQNHECESYGTFEKLRPDDVRNVREKGMVSE